MVLVYVDDIILTGSCTNHINDFKEYLKTKFKLRDLGNLKYFLGLEIERSKSGIYIHQKKYALNLLSNTGLLDTKSSTITMKAQHNLRSDSGVVLSAGEASSIEDWLVN